MSNNSGSSLIISESGVAPRLTLEAGGNVGVNTLDPDAALHVNGSMKLVDGTQGAGKVLTSDADGNATWSERKRSITITPSQFAPAHLAGASLAYGPNYQPCVEFPEGIWSEGFLSVPLPEEFNTTGFAIRVLYSSDATGGDLHVNLATRGHAIGSDLGLFVGGPNPSTPGPTVANVLQETVLTSAIIGPDSRLVHILLRRRGDLATDTNTGLLRVYGLIIEWIP